ncbi:TAXI family TRAP transporter solute-binding subunit [bacterium]|nr:TAXI family TRAP transporter solute-binding subunit [bacterium]
MHSFPRFIRAFLPLLAAAAVLLSPVALPAFPQPSLSISSGNTTGTYYAASSAIAKIFNRKAVEYDMRIATVSTQGSVANVNSVLEGGSAFGIAESVMLQRAAKGLDPWDGKAGKGLRAVLGLHLESVTIVAAADRGISTVNDLKGKRLNIGAPGSSDNEYGAILLEQAGLKPADVTLSEHPAALASEFLQRDKIDAYLYTVGHPNLSVLEAGAGERKVLLVPLDQQLIDHLTAANPLLIPTLIPTNFYPTLERQGAVPTIGVRAVLFTRADMADETVYRLVREVMTNFDLFRRQHPVLQGMTPGDAAGITAIPLHPGAERYFRESGLAP